MRARSGYNPGMPVQERPSELAKRFGAIIKRLRIQRGLTVAQLAQSVNFHYNSVSVLEQGKNMPSIASLLQFAKALGVDPRDLLAEAAGLPERPAAAPPTPRSPTG
jgi:transcriptional regulator with XRE-family HTH domain